MDDFFNDDIAHYDKLTDAVLQGFVSGLGKYLAYELLDIREIINDLLEGYDSDEKKYETFIRAQLEIFNDVSSKYIRDPTKYKDKLQEIYHTEIGKDYPQAIVNHNNSRNYVMDKFKQF